MPPSTDRSPKARGATPRIVAVFTGDIVASSELPTSELQRLPAVLQTIARAARKVWGADVVPFGIDAFRGDSWQWLAMEPTLALRLAIYVRASLRGQFPDHDVVTRVAIGLGAITAMPKDRVSQGLGPAFTASGQGLENMGKRADLAITRADRLPAGPELEGATLGLIHALAAGWTAAQARAVAGALEGHTQAEIAQQWEPAIDRTAVVRHLERAAWPEVEAAISAWEDVTKNVHFGE